MKKNKFILVICLILVAALGIIQTSQAAVESQRDIFEVLTNIADFLFTALLIVAVIFILIAAFNFLTAQGDAEKVKSARNQILWAVVAIAIALISTGAASIIESFLP
jgi:hypothetical protein